APTGIVAACSYTPGAGQAYCTTACVADRTVDYCEFTTIPTSWPIELRVDSRNPHESCPIDDCSEGTREYGIAQAQGTVSSGGHGVVRADRRCPDNPGGRRDRQGQRVLRRTRPATCRQPEWSTGVARLIPGQRRAGVLR